MSPVHFCFQMLPKSLIPKIVEETNRYASQKLYAGFPGPKARWKSVDLADIFRFLSILIALEIIRLRCKNDLWTEPSPEVIKLPSVAHVMPMRRFMDIKHFFHLENNDLAVPRGSEEYDPLHKVRQVYGCLQLRCRNGWRMGTYASLDESMTNWEGRSHFKQYKLSKPIRWGYKFLCICDSTTGYIK